MQRIALFLVCLMITYPVLGSADKYAVRFDFGGYFFTDSPKASAVINGYIPIYQNQSTVFYSDIRALQKSNSKAREFNAALGYRKLLNDEKYMFGTYLFYDNKRTGNSSIFGQFTCGLESWYNKYFLGGNFYLPVGRRAKESDNVVVVNSSSNLVSAGSELFNIALIDEINNIIEVALVGGDITAGWQINRPLSIFGGGYYYHSSTSSFKVPTILGGMLRLLCILDTSWQKNKKFFGVFDRCNFEALVQYDKQRKWRGYLGITLSLLTGTPTRSLSIMQRHMTEKPFRDIDVVSLSQTSGGTVETFAVDNNGQKIVVSQPAIGEDPTTEFGNADVQIIAIDGLHPDFDNTKRLAEGQIITSGDYTTTISGQSITVNLGTDGELRSKSGEQLLTLGKDNTVQNVTLTMLNPPNTEAGNRAIVLDGTVNDIGTVTIDNVSSNGVLYAERNGATQTGEVIIKDSSFITPDSWNPPSNSSSPVRLLGFEINSGATISAKITDTTIQVTNIPTKNIIDGIGFKSGTGSTVTVQEISNNTINVTNTGIRLQGNGGDITVTGVISNNNISNIGSVSIIPAVSGIWLYSTNGSPTFQLNSAITNNTISVIAGGIGMSNIGGTAPIFNLPAGITNNNVTSTASEGITFVANLGGTPTATVTNMFANQSSAPSGDIIISNGGTTVNVNDGANGLSAANNGVNVFVSGGATVNPGP